MDNKNREALGYESDATIDMASTFTLSPTASDMEGTSFGEDTPRTDMNSGPLSESSYSALGLITKRVPEHEKEAAKNAPSMPAHVQHYHIKILVAGESGLGKTTCINNLFTAFTKENVLSKPCVKNEQRRVLEPKTVSITEHEEFSITYSDGLHVAHFTLVDTPGYGDDLNVEKTINRIHKYVEDQLRKFEKQSLLKGEERLNATGDPRVTCILYFIAAHRLKLIDIKFFNRLKEIAPVIPVIAKADTMTREETTEFKRVVTESLNLVETMHSSMASIHKHSPFTVVSSQKFKENIDYDYPVREYKWGTCESLNPAHSDTALLKSELFETSFHALQKEKEQMYCEWQEGNEKRRKELEEEERMKAELARQESCGGCTIM